MFISYISFLLVFFTFNSVLPWPITPDFPVEPFRGQKELVISMVTWFGGQNYFLPIAYLVTSGLILVTAVVLTTVYVKVGKKGKNMEEWTKRWKCPSENNDEIIALKRVIIRHTPYSHYESS